MSREHALLSASALLKPRWAISLMLRPMTRTEIRRARGQLEQGAEGEASEARVGSRIAS